MRYGTGMVLVLTAGVLWSFQALMIRQIEGANVWAVLAWRSLGMVPVLFAFIYWRSKGRPWAMVRATGLAGVLGGIGLVVAMGGAILAFQTTTAANAAFLFAASPFIAAILGWVILGEAVQPRTWGAIAIAIIGILIMVSDGLAAGDMLGNVAALISALGFASFSVVLRWGKAADSMPGSLLGGIFALVLGAAMTLQTTGSLAMEPVNAMWCLFMGAVTMSGGSILYTLGSRVVPSAELTLLSNTEVLLAPFWVWLVLHETASPATFIGGGIVLVAILANAYIGVRRATLA